MYLVIYSYLLTALPTIAKIRNATISAATMVGPTGVDANMDMSIPKSAQDTDKIADTIVTPLKLLHTLIAERAGKIMSAEIRSEPTRFIASTIITAVITAIKRLYTQIIFRENVTPMIRGKHVLILMASVTTGFTAKRSIEAVGYYGGIPVGIAAIYRAVDEVEGHVVRSVYSVNDLPDYESYDYRACPFCKQGAKIDALVNSFGYSAL